MIPRDTAPEETAPQAICRQLLERWSGPHRQPVPPRVAEAASAVAVYCSHDLDRRALSDRHLHLLFSRALCRAGEKDAARRMLDERGDDAGHAESCLAVLDQAQAPWPAVDWLARRVCRASDFTAFSGGTCWTLDWRRVRPAEGAALEFAYAALLRALIGEVAPLWDPSRGRGTLAHLGLARHLSGAIGGRRSARLAWTREMLELSGRFLAREAALRGWAEVPACRLVDATY